MPAEQLKREVQNLLVDGDVKAGLELVRQRLKDDSRHFNTILLLLGQYNSTKRQENNFLIQPAQAATTYARLRNSLLQIVAEIKPEDLGAANGASKDTITLFLASSAELKEDRDEIEIFIRRENDRLRRDGFYLKLNLWEDFLDAMSKTRLQDEYNKVVADSDVFISLFGSKVGKYTEEEFDVAYNSFQSKGKPKYIYTYFKEFDGPKDDSLERFFKKVSDLGHFPNSYSNKDGLLRHLRDQLDRIIVSLKA